MPIALGFAKEVPLQHLTKAAGVATLFGTSLPRTLGEYPLKGITWRVYPIRLVSHTNHGSTSSITKWEDRLPPGSYAIPPSPPSLLYSQLTRIGFTPRPGCGLGVKAGKTKLLNEHAIHQCMGGLNEACWFWEGMSKSIHHTPCL